MHNRSYGRGDLATTNRQYGGFLGKMLLGFWISEMQKAMSHLIK